jgi:hypothetical protein
LSLGLRFILHTNDLGFRVGLHSSHKHLEFRVKVHSSHKRLGFRVGLHSSHKHLGFRVGFHSHKQLGFRVSFHSSHKYLCAGVSDGWFLDTIIWMSFDESRSNMKSNLHNIPGLRVVHSSSFWYSKPTVGARALFSL